MKKIIAALLVLAVAVPALATNVDVNQVSGTEVRIEYDASGDSSLVRAFNIDVVLDDPNIVITGGNTFGSDYWVSPGSFKWSSRARIYNKKWPLGGKTVATNGFADPRDHPDTLGLENKVKSNSVTLEQGSLYGDVFGFAVKDMPASAPGTTGYLNILMIQEPNLLSSPTTSPYQYIYEPNIVISMSDNNARGGILLEDGGTGSSYGTTTLYLSTLTRVEYANWLKHGGGNPGAAPRNWRGWCWRCGDVNADGFVTFSDVIAAFDYFKDTTSKGEGDINMSGFETFSDVIETFDLFKGGAGCTPCVP